MQRVLESLCALLIAGLLVLPAQAAQEVSVNDLGADSTGTQNSTQAFQQAVWLAGPRGVVTCEPGRYMVGDVLLFFSSVTLDCPAELIPASGATALLRVGYWEDKPKPRYLNIRVHSFNGRDASGLYCLDLLDVELSHFEIDRIIGCERGISIDPERSNVSDNRFVSSYWGSNKTALYLVSGNGWAQGNRFDVNFVARNDLGIHMPDSSVLAGLNQIETSLDLNGRDAIIESVDGLYRFSFVTPSAPPIGGGLRSSFVHILDSWGGHRTWKEPLPR